MRYGRNVNPEWGYLAPAPSVMRTARLVAVAAISARPWALQLCFRYWIGR